jgi:hypothetical protein
MQSVSQKFGISFATITALAFLALGVTASNATAQEPYQAHIDWAAQNTDAGGSVDCADQYINNGVAYAIVSGGRAAVINQALFEAYNQNFGHAFTLVPITQCHNPDAQQVLLAAGQKKVLTYLISNYQPTGIDPNQVIALGQAALEALIASGGM